MPRCHSMHITHAHYPLTHLLWRCVPAQELLQALSGVAAKHGVSIADVSAKWVLDKPQVGADHSQTLELAWLQ